MNVKQIFDSNFVSSVQTLLDEKCVNGAALTRAELCKHLDLSVPDDKQNLVLEGVIGALITLSVITGFESRKGPGGGIGKVGEKRVASPKEKGAASAKEVTYPEGFLDKLDQTLSTMCAAGMKPARRKDIATAMAMPGSDTEALISAAIKDASGLGARYESQRGVGGGIKARSVAVPVQASTNAPEVATTEPAVVEPANDSAPELQAAPETASNEPAADASADQTSTDPAPAKKGGSKKKGSKKS